MLRCCRMSDIEKLSSFKKIFFMVHNYYNYDFKLDLKVGLLLIALLEVLLNGHLQFWHCSGIVASLLFTIQYTFGLYGQLYCIRYIKYIDRPTEVSKIKLVHNIYRTSPNLFTL